jgi:hypothetical protein
MSKPPDDLELAAILRDNLRRLPAPTPSADFDACVLAALTQPLPWWHLLWQTARPLLAGAACSLVVTLAAVSWATQTPSAPPRVLPLSATAATRPLDMAAVDRLLDQPDLSAASLFRWEIQPSANTPVPDRRPPPHVRRASRLSTPLLA